MDSKYTLINSSRGEIHNNGIKRIKPTPILFNNAKKIKLNVENSSPSKNATSNSNYQQNKQLQSIQEQRRSLPVFAVRNRLLEEIKKRHTLIIMAETGSGKTTQIPQFIHSARLESNGKIAVTQPRRVAAITISKRVSQEMNTELGGIVGYSVRFEDATSKQTKIKYLTDGMLLREAITDKLLLSYNIIILDEAHERTVHTDVLFGIVKQAQKSRNSSDYPPLKIIVMSATMDVDHFSKYFNNCKPIYLEGKTFPVNVYHSVKNQEDYQYACLITIFQIHKKAPANEDILVFLTGQEEIESLAQNIRVIVKDPEFTGPTIKVYPLYAGLPNHQQLNVFKPTPPGSRKVILSTNIAETSLTISGIKYIIDSGMVKARTHHPGTGLDMLRVQKISQAQAIQRTGRAGREFEGSCYRLYTKREFSNFHKNTIPEIQRCNLSNVILQLLALEIDVKNFDFMDKPAEESIESAIQQLFLLGAINANTTTLTRLGKNMSTFPLDPKFSKILLSAPTYGCVEEMLSIIALLSSDNIYITPSIKKEEAILARRKYMSNLGDHISLLNIYRTYKSTNEKKQWCHENYLNSRNLVYATEVRNQLVEICQRCGIQTSSCGSNMDQVRKCLLTGFFMNVAELHNEKKYVALNTKKQVVIHPSSVLHRTFPNYVLYTEIISTGKCYMRNISTIDPDWLQEIAPEYLRSHRLTNKFLNSH